MREVNTTAKPQAVAQKLFPYTETLDRNDFWGSSRHASLQVSADRQGHNLD